MVGLCFLVGAGFTHVKSVHNSSVDIVILLTAVRMQDMSALADSAQAPDDMISLVADQHASMAANCVVHGRMAAATTHKPVRECRH